MRRLLKYLFIVAVLVLVCTPCALVTTTDPLPPKETHDCDGDSCPFPEPPTRTIYSQENWQFSVPGKPWVKSSPDVGLIKLAIRNESRDRLILVLKEKNNSSYSRYVVNTINAFVEGGSYVGTISQVVINDNRFVEIQIDNGDSTIWAWITVKDGFGYGFTCGGDIDPDAGIGPYDLCHDVAQTIELK